MTHRIRAATALALVLATLGLLVPAGASARTMGQRIARAVARSGIAGSTDVLAYDATTQRQLYGYQPDRAVAPASNEKLYTTVAVLHALGPTWRFHTKLAIRGTVTGGTLDGSVVLIGGGDPVLGTPKYTKTHFDGVGTDLGALADALKDRGVTHVTGRLVVDETYLDTQRYVTAWPARFRFHESAALGALVVNQNATRKYWSATTASREPAEHAGLAFRQLLEARGITIDGKTVNRAAPPDAVTIKDLTSPPVWKILRFMDRESDNFTAEMLLKGLGRAQRGKGTTADGVTALRVALRGFGVDMSSVHNIDGSGLAAGNRTSARDMANLLSTVDHDAALSPVFRSLLAVSGRRGTLRTRMRRSPYRGRVVGKTGTLSQASALSGYATRVSNGHRYGFSVMVYAGSGRVSVSAAHALQDAIAEILVK